MRGCSIRTDSATHAARTHTHTLAAAAACSAYVLSARANHIMHACACRAIWLEMVPNIWELYLQDVGNGTLSVNRLGAYCAATPEPRPPEVAALAACRGHHAERTLHRWVQRQPWNILPAPYEFKVPKNKSSVRGLGRTMHICRMRHLRLWLRSQTCGNSCWAARTTSAPFGLVRLRPLLRLGKNGSQESRRSGPLSIPIRLGPTPCISFALWACTGMRRGVMAIAKFWS